MFGPRAAARLRHRLERQREPARGEATPPRRLRQRNDRHIHGGGRPPHAPDAPAIHRRPARRALLFEDRRRLAAPIRVGRERLRQMALQGAQPRRWAGNYSRRCRRRRCRRRRCSMLARAAVRLAGDAAGCSAMTRDERARRRRSTVSVSASVRVAHISPVATPFCNNNKITLQALHWVHGPSRGR